MATTDFWNGTGNWSTDDAAWSDDSPPISTEDAEIQTGTASLTATATIAALQVDASSVLDLAGAGAALTDTGDATVAGDLELSAEASAGVTGDLSITGNGYVWLDSPYNNGGGGSSLTIGGTLTDSSTNGNALFIGTTNIGTGDTVTAIGLVNTGVIEIDGNGTIQSTLDITGGVAGFGTVAVETGSVSLINNALLEFAAGQISTIDGLLSLSGVNARIADAGTLATNSALTGLTTVAGDFRLSAGASVTTSGGLGITGSGDVWLDSPYNNGGGGSSLTIGGTLTDSSTNGNALFIGTTNIGTGDTVTAIGLVNTGVIEIDGNGTIQSTLDITGGVAGFGTVAVETGSVSLINNALLEFAAGQIGTIDGLLSLSGVNARIADAGTPATNSALTGLTTVAGDFRLSAGASVTTSGGLGITGSGDVWLDSPYNNGGGGSSLTIGGTLTDSSTNGNALFIGTTNIGTGDTVTAIGLVNTGVIEIDGNGTIQSTLDITGGVAGFGTVAVETGSVSLINNALLEFAAGQIGTIDGLLSLSGVNARIADAGTPATNSALTGLTTVAGDFRLSAGASVTTSGGLGITGSGDVWLDSPYNNGGGGSSLTIGGTLTDSSTNGNALFIGTTNIGTGDTVTAIGLVNTGVIEIDGNGTIQSTLDITGGVAGFGTVAVETGSVSLINNALLEFAAGQIGTIDGLLSLSGVNARIADAGTPATNSALTGLTTVAGDFRLSAGASVTTSGGLGITGSGDVWLDSPYNNGGGGSSLTIGGTLTDSSTNGNALFIGTTNIGTGDTVTAIGLVNTGVIEIDGNGTIQSTLDITGGVAGFGTVAVETGSVSLINNALLEFAAGQIGTIDGLLSLSGVNARIADAGTPATNSALTGLTTVAGDFRLSAGASVTTSGGLGITGSGDVWLDSPYNNGGGGSSLTIGGTLTDSSTNGNALFIGTGNISTGDTVTAKGLINTGAISIEGNGTVQSTLDITNQSAGFGTVGVETASLNLINNALLEFAAGQIGTIDGLLSLSGVNARIADAATLATNSALTGLTTVAGDFLLSAGASVTTSGGLSITGSGEVWLDSPYNNGLGGSSLTIGGTLTDSSTNGNALFIGTGNISTGDTVTAAGLVNTGVIEIEGNGTTLATLAVNGPATNSATVQIYSGGELLMGAGDVYTQAADFTAIYAGGTLAGTVDVAGGHLDGTGTAAGTVNDTSGGTVFAGLSIGTPGTLTVNGTYNQSGTGDLEANIGSGGTSSGVVSVSGGGYANLTGGTLSVSSTPAVGSLLTVMTFAAGHLAGQFAAVQDGSAIGDGSFVNLGDGTSLEVFYNEDSGNIQIERVENSSLAASYQWTDATGNWSTAADWSGGVVPNPTANVVIGNTTTGNVTLNGSSGDATVNSLLIEASNALTVSGVTLTSATGGGGISVAADASLSLSSGELNGSVLSGAGLLQTSGGTSALADDTISAGTGFVGQDNTATELVGPIDNAGSIEQIGGNGQNGYLIIADEATLTGGGTLTLDSISTNGGAAYIQGNGQTLTNTNNTIQGTGVIGNGSLALVNGGIIDATPEGGTATLTLNGGGITNTGTMKASGGATLVIEPIVDNAGGNITTADSTSTVELLGATVQGGTLNNTVGGTFETASGATLDGSTHGTLTISSKSTVIATDNTNTYLLGTIDNAGLLEQVGGNGQIGALVIENAVTLTGGGTLILDTIATNNGSAYIEGNGGTLTNVNDTIEGTGFIGNGSLALINKSVIDATPESGTATLTLNGSGGVTNTDLLEATAGATLSIETNVTNTGGKITATGSLSTVVISNGATITGGTLTTSSGGAMATGGGNATLQGVTISASSTYTASDNLTTTLLGVIDNVGTIAVIGGNAQNGVLAIGNAVTLTGGGTVLLDTIKTNGANAYIQGNGQTLTVASNTILGTGIIGNGSLVLINNSVIDATPEGGTSQLTLDGGQVTNTKTMEASAGGVLAIETTVNNTGGNIITADATSTVDVSGGRIEGGTLKNTAGGTFETTGNSTLDGSTEGTLTISSGSTVTATDNTTTFLLGTIDNAGLLEQVGGNAQNGYLYIENGVTLTGDGTVTLDDVATSGGNAFLMGNSGTLTNTNNTIQGTGVIGNGSLVVINGGVIDATPEGGSAQLTLNGTGVTNTSTMEASAGGVLTIETIVNNAGGNIITVDATSTVDVSSGRIEGGTLKNTAGGTFETTGNSTLDGSTEGTLTISSGSTVTATDNTTTFLLGTIDNAGLLEQVGGNAQNGYLYIENGVTLTGDGTVTLDDVATSGGNAFLMGNSGTLTNTNNTIQGTGVIGNGSLVVINGGVIDATPEGGSAQLTLNGTGVTNTSTMEASAGGFLAIETIVNNAGGNIITADGTSTVDVSGGRIEGGTLKNTAGGTFETTGNSTLDGSTEGTLTISSGSTVTATDDTITFLLGTIDNAGLLEQVGGNAQNGYLYIDNAVTLIGGGTVTLDDIAANGGNAFLMGNSGTLTNTNNTIQGTGVIGNGSLVVINGGVIDATPEGGTSTLTVNNSGGFTSTGTLEATGGATLVLDVGAITASGLVSVAVGSAIDLDGELHFTGTISNFGAINGGGATEVAFGSGSDRLIMGPGATFGGTVVGDGTTSVIELAAGTSAGTLTGLGTSFANFGTVIVDAGATWTVDAATSLLPSTTFIGNGASSTLALTNAGTFSLATVSDFGTIDLATGNNSVTVTDATLSGGSVTIVAGASGNNTISAKSDTSASKGKSLTYVAGTGTDSFTGGFENDTVDVSSTAVGGDTLTGGSGTNVLTLTSGGTPNLGGVTKFPTIDLAASGITLTVTDALLSSGTLTINDEASGNAISAASDTSASKGKTLTYNAGAGTDSFTGGFENDAVHVSAASIGGDTLTGGSGTNTLTLTTAGTVNLGGVSKFPTIDLAAGNSTVALTDTTLSGGSVTINDGTSGSNTISAAGDTSASKGKTLTYNAGTGKDSFTGGFENDTIRVAAVVVNSDTLTGGSGTNALILTSAGSVFLGGVSDFGTVNLAAGNNTVSVTKTTLSGGTVTIIDGASGNNSVSAAGDTTSSEGKTLIYNTGSGMDTFTGGLENDTVHVTAAAVGGDTLTGGTGSNAVVLTSAGIVNLAGVSKFPTILLAAGTNTVTVTDTTLSGGSVGVHAGATGNNTVSAAGDTSASKGKILTYFAATGTDTFTGGFEDDVVRVSAAAVAGDTLTGGSGPNTIILTTAGSVDLGGASGFATIDLAAGNNTVTVTDTTLSGGMVNVHDGASGNNSVSAAGDSAASKGKTLDLYAGSGTDSFTGGFENDVVRVSAAAVADDTLTGGSGTNAVVLTTFGSVNLGGVSNFSEIDLAAGASTVTVTDTTLSGGTVTINDGASGNETVSAAGDTSASTGKTLVYFTGTGKDKFTGGFENDTIHVAAATVGGDTLTGGSGMNTLELTSAGTVNLGGVSKFATILLDAGNSTVTVTDATLSSGAVGLHDGASGNNTVSAAGDTSASVGKALTYFAGTGTDVFTGGFENDAVRVSAAAVGGDTLTGGSGKNTLTLTSAGSVNLGGVSKFATIDLAAGNSTVTVTDTTLSGGSVTINDGTSGNNSVSAAGDTAASEGKSLTYMAGSGTDSFTGGFENDTIYAGTGLGTYTAGSGSDTFVFIKSSLPTQTLDNFLAGSDDLLVYGIHSGGGFDLGTTDNGLNPMTPTAITASIFTENATGAFTSSTQRFAYDTSNGQLLYSATGSNGSETTVATLTGEPAITASNLLFEH